MNRADEAFQMSEMISRYMLGEITDAEKARLEQWVEASPRNKQLFDTWVQEKYISDKVQAYGRIDRKTALRDLLDHKRRMEKAVRRRRVVRVIEYAAVILLPLAVAFYLYIGSGDKAGTSASVTEARVEFPAGQSKAELRLPDGKVVELSLGVSRQIMQEDGVTIEQDSGMIRYEVKGITGKREEQYHTITVPRGGEFALELGDGTHIWLNAESVLRFPEEFVGAQREVYLEGEAYFDVSHDATKRFVVRTRDAEVRVYGTEFNVSAYTDEPGTVATLVNGSVGMKAMETSLELDLKPGEQARLVGGSLTKQMVDTEAYTAWVKGRLVFNSVRLEDMMRRLARWYNVEVVFGDPALKEVTFTGEVRKYEDFMEILEVIEMTGVARFEIKDRVITVLNK